MGSATLDILTLYTLSVSLTNVRITGQERQRRYSAYLLTMLNVSCNFSAFCKNTTSTYQLINEESKFMGPTTFRKWFFAWASSQNIEFRQQCPGCGPEPVVLAGDGTKIGIKASAKNTTPIERYGNQESLSTRHRRGNK